MEKETRSRGGEAPRAAASEVADIAREQTRAVLDQARRSGLSLLDEQRHVFARYAQRWASAMHSAATHLDQEGDPASGRYAHWAGQGLDRFSKSVTSGSTDDFIQQASDFARRRPAVFMGGAVLAGMALSQLFKSSMPREEESRIAEPPRGVHTDVGEIYPRPEAEYGELETRKPGAPPH